jgi:CDP-diacylglycerol--glycerol-3-phosphate 3-phosphatidyltransferase
MVLATAFPLLMPVILVQLVNGSLLTTALRLRAAHREMVAQRQQEQQRVDEVVLFTAVAA